MVWDCTNYNWTWLAQAANLTCDDAEGLIMVCYCVVLSLRSSSLSALVANVVPLLSTEDTNALFVLRSASRFYCWLWKSIRASTFHWNLKVVAWLSLAIRPIFEEMMHIPALGFQFGQRLFTINNDWCFERGDIRVLSNILTIMHYLYELMDINWEEFVFALDIYFVFMYWTVWHTVASLKPLMISATFNYTNTIEFYNTKILSTSIYLAHRNQLQLEINFTEEPDYSLVPSLR